MRWIFEEIESQIQLGQKSCFSLTNGMDGKISMFQFYPNFIEKA